MRTPSSPSPLCNLVGELLPWYLNGSLEPGEQELVTRHLADCPACRQEHRETAFSVAALASHPTAEQLVDFTFHRLSLSPDRPKVERHLALCETCAEEVRLIETSRDALHEDEASGDPLVVPFSRPIPIAAARPVKPWRTFALAASVVLAVALGYFMATVGPRRAAQTADQTGAEEPGDVVSRAGLESSGALATVDEILTKAGENPFTLSLVAARPGTFEPVSESTAARLVLPGEPNEVQVQLATDLEAGTEALEIVLLDANDRRLWHGIAATWNAGGELEATLPGMALPAGKVKIRLRRSGPAGPENLAELALEIVPR